MLLLVPVILLNSGYREISSIFNSWSIMEQERFAEQKLGEIAAHTDISHEISVYAAEFRRQLDALVTNYRTDRFPVAEIASASLPKEFPEHELLVFQGDSNLLACKMVFSNKSPASRRSMEMIQHCLLLENLGINQGQHNARLNGKLLQKIFGNGCSIELAGSEQRGITTPVIYRGIPSFLVWVFAKSPHGEIIAFMLIVPRNQDLVAAAYQLAARKTGLGTTHAGGFVKIFASATTSDCLFPARLHQSGLFSDWRQTLGSGETDLKRWQKQGFPWGEMLGQFRVYTRILPLEKHLAVLLLRNPVDSKSEEMLHTASCFFAMIVFLLVMRGLILGRWSFYSIRARFVLVFCVAVSLPVTLFLTSATAYVFERLKADENSLEQLLTTCLLDFDAGKEALENEYIAAFSQMLKDDVVIGRLKESQLASGKTVAERLRQIANSRKKELTVSGIAIYDLAGDFYCESRGNLRSAEFSTMVGFYGLPFSINLRRTVALEEPDYRLPKHRIDESSMVAMQSVKKGNEGIESEIERFRFRVVRTDLGRGHLSYLYDYVCIDGRPRYVMMIAWLDTDVDRVILRRAADQIALRNPQIKIVGFKKTSAGTEDVLPPDRSVSARQLKSFHRVADSAFSIRSGLTRTIIDQMSVVAYASRHFRQILLIAGIDHLEKNAAHFYRVAIIGLFGFVGLLFLVVSAVVTYSRIAKPLDDIKSAFAEVASGRPGKIGIDKRTDEIGLLANEFVKMSAGLEERRHLASLLSDQALAAISVSDTAVLEAQNFHGVVLISDIRDFTTMCEKNEPQIITGLLNTHFAEMTAAITANGGRIYKFIGDAVEAVFVEDHRQPRNAAQRAITASLDMLARLEKINQQRLEDKGFGYRIGIGLAAGELVGGETGSKNSRMDYAILGTAFREAEELEAKTREFPACPLLISEKVFADSRIANLEWIREERQKHVFFRLESLPEIDKGGLKGIRRQELAESEAVVEKAEYKGSFDFRWPIFVFGFIAALFPVAAWLISIYSWQVAEFDRQNRIASEHCQNTLMKLDIPDSEALILNNTLTVAQRSSLPILAGIKAALKMICWPVKPLQ